MQFALCLDNTDYLASLEVGQLYQVASDEQSVAHGCLRIGDESGADYAFAAARFHLVSLSDAVEQALLSAIRS